MDIEIIELLTIIFIIMIPVLFSQIFYFPTRTKQFMKIREWIIPITLGSSAILCMLFPVVMFDSMKFDLSQIPIILAGLYFGFLTSYKVFTLAILFQFFFFDEINFILFFILYLFVASVVPLFSKKFLQLNLLYKLLISNGLTLIVSILSSLIIESIVVSDVKTSLFVEYISIHLLVMVISVLFIEIIKNNQNLLQRRIKIEKLELAGHLAASISHEVRNPLTTSRGFMQLLYSEVHPSKHEYINIAIKEIDEAVNIIREYLTFAKPIAEYEEVINIKEEVQHILNLSTPLAKMYSVEIAFNKVEDVHFVLGERKKLQQSLLNIVKNGIESMENGGKLELNISSSKSHVLICIKDTGVGMSKEQINRLGEPYFSTKEKGTGLSMMVSYRIIESMGGTITVNSQLEKGTHFSIKLPVYKEG